MKKILTIKDRNKTLYFKNRKVRTPCTIEVTDKEIAQLQPTLKMLDIQKYSVKSMSKEGEEKSVVDVNTKEVVIEELDFESSKDESSKTILEKLMNGEGE